MINRTLGTALEPGRVYLSTQAHRHIATDHAGDYRLVMDTIEVAIREPTYLGQAPRQASNFELIKRVAVQEEDESGKVLRRYHVLIAVSLEPDDRGDYRVASGYCVKEQTIERRRAAGRLFPPQKG